MRWVRRWWHPAAFDGEACAPVRGDVFDVDAFATAGSDVDFENELRLVFAMEGRRLFAGGPSSGLLGLLSAASNPWFVEPSLRRLYVDRCRSGDVPTPVDVESARRVAWSFVSVFGDGWPLGVFEDQRVLGVDAYRQHATLLLALHERDVDALVELRSRPARSGWAFINDGDFAALYSSTPPGVDVIQTIERETQ